MSEGSETKSFPWKRLLALGITIAALMLVFRKVDATALGRAFLQMRVGWFVAAVVVYGFVILCGAWRWHLMLKLTGSPVHLLAAIRLYFIGHCLNFLLLGPAVGDLAKSALYARWFRQPLPQVIAAAPLDRLLGLAGLAVFCALAFLVAAAKGLLASTSGFKVPPSLVIGTLATGVIGMMIVMRWRPKSESAVVKTFNTFAETFTRLVLAPRLALPGFLLGFAVQALSCVTSALCLAAVIKTPLPWLEMLWTFPVISAFTAVPSVGGLGVREVAAQEILKLYNVPAEAAVAGSLLLLGTNIVFVGVGGFLLWREDRRYEQLAATPRGEVKTLSVVVPTLNEAEEIGVTLERVRQIPEVMEVILVDGGSTDRTVEIARQAGCRLLASTPSRGHQLRLGAETATGDVILFLHADTWLAPDAGRDILNCLHDQTTVGGGGWKVFRPVCSRLLRGSRLKCWLRLVISQRVMADQAMFVRREVLTAIGGVPDQPLMEEFELCRRLRGAGRLALADTMVITSARRFARLGVLRTYARMWRVTLLYHLGRSPDELRRLYEK
jgi:rSAM/selenodomain-associated transferase 2